MPSPTFTGLLAEWLAGASEETKRWYATRSHLDPLELFVWLREDRPIEEHMRLRTLILCRLDESEDKHG